MEPEEFKTTMGTMTLGAFRDEENRPRKQWTKKRRKPMSEKNINTITDCIMDRAVRAHFAKLFSEGTDADGTPLRDLYLLHADSQVLMARGKPPVDKSHGWAPEDERTPRLAAVYHPWADRFDVTSFVIKEVISPTEIEIALYDIFTLDPNRFDYFFESKGDPFNLVVDFETKHYEGLMRPVCPTLRIF